MDTKIVVSFPMMKGGYEFATWLRDRLMKQYGLHVMEAVYVDFVASRHLPETEGSHLTIGLDERPHMASRTGAKPIGARRDDWDEMFVAALRSAAAAVIVLTGDYIASWACNREVTQVDEENPRRRGAGLGALRVVVLNLLPFDTEATRSV